MITDGVHLYRIVRYLPAHTDNDEAAVILFNPHQGGRIVPLRQLVEDFNLV